MAQRTVLAEVKQLKRAEQHAQWLRANLPKHSITQRVERELLLRRTELAITHGDTVSSVCSSVANCKPNQAWVHKRKERAEARSFRLSFRSD